MSRVPHPWLLSLRLLTTAAFVVAAVDSAISGKSVGAVLFGLAALGSGFLAWKEISAGRRTDQHFKHRMRRIR